MRPQFNSFNYSYVNVLAIALVIAASAATAKADAVTDWNAITFGHAGAAGRPGGAVLIDLAVVHAAQYDAVQAIERDYEPYRIGDVPNATGSPIAAAVKAARDVLVARFPTRATIIQGQYDTYLLNNSIDPSDPGIAVGTFVAAKLLAYRACDDSMPSPRAESYVGGTAIGQWRPTPGVAAMNPGEWFGNITPFFMTRPSQFRSDPPPALDSPQYEQDYEEVRLYGAATGSERSADQTSLALFWNAPGREIFAALRNVSNANVNNVSGSSRLFALASMAGADATIGVWNDKYYYSFWRPYTAIREEDNNPRTQSDPNWTPLLNTPPYPDHTSGANGISGSVFQSMTDFFETDNMSFSVTHAASGATRQYTSFSQIMQELVDARVYLGIHFRFADKAGRKLGQNAAKWGHKNYLRPVKGATN
jgi:hypothetical protein